MRTAAIAAAPRDGARPWRKRARWVSLGIDVAAVVALGLRAPVDVTDTPTYVDNHLVRTPGYPWFLDVFQVLSPGHWRQATVLAQHALAAVAVWFLAQSLWRWLAKRTGDGAGDVVVTEWALPWVLRWFLFVPVIMYGNVLSTETLAYALLCAVGQSLTELIFAPSPRTFLRPASFCALLLLVRPQFIFLAPIVVVVVGAAAFVWSRDVGGTRAAILSRLARPLALAVALLAGQGLVARTYHAIRHGVFMSEPITGIQIAVMGLYVSRASDERAFPDEEARVWFRATRATCEAKQLLLEQKQPGQWTSIHFYLSYWQIAEAVYESWYHDVAKHPGPAPYPYPGWPLGPDDLIRADGFLRHASLHLLRATFPRYAVLVARTLWQGSREWGLLVVLISAAAALALVRTRRREAAFLVVMCAIWIGNRTLLALVQAYDPRYTFYTDYLLLAVVPLYVGRSLRPSSAPVHAEDADHEAR